MTVFECALYIVGVAVAALAAVCWHDWLWQTGRIDSLDRWRYRGYENRATWLCVQQLVVEKNLKDELYTRQAAFDLAYHLHPDGIRGCQKAYKEGRTDWNYRSEKVKIKNDRLGDINWGEVSDALNCEAFHVMRPTDPRE